MGTKYDESSIERYAGLSGIQKRPTVYAGEMDSNGLWTCLREPADNAVDQALAGRNKLVHLITDSKPNTYWVVDAGEGIPVGKKIFEDEQGRKERLSTFFLVTGLIHGGGNFSGENISRGCFSGGTKVRLLSNKIVTMEQLYRRWSKSTTPIEIMSFNLKTQCLQPSNISHVQLTKHVKELIRLTLDDGSICEVTPDHPFYINALRGTIQKVRAEDLIKNDSLVSTYYSFDKDGYLVQTQQGKKKLTHRVVGNYYNKIRPKIDQIHYKFRNKLDNRSTKLEILTQAEHHREHEEERKAFHRNRVLTTKKGSIQRKRLSKIAKIQNYDALFILNSKKVKCIKVAAKAIVNYGHLSKETYEKVRRRNEPSIAKALEEQSLVELRVNAKSYINLLLSKEDISSKAGRDLDELYDLSGIDSTEYSKNANWIKSLIVWKEHLLSFKSPSKVMPIDFDERSSAVIYGRYSQLRRYTSLETFKQHVLNNKPLLLYKDLSEEAQKIRMYKAKISLANEVSLHKTQMRFINIVRNHLSSFSEEEYVNTRVNIKPDWCYAIQVIKHLNDIDTSEVENFVYSYNHKVVKVEKVQLKKAVPVYDITVDNTHTFFIEPGVLVSNTFGVGIKLTNALALSFKVWTFREGVWYAIEYAKGKLTKDVYRTKCPTLPHSIRVTRGTIVYFQPDLSYFDKGSTIIPKVVEDWCKLSSYLVPDLTIKVTNSRGKTKTYLAKNGIRDFIEERKLELECEINGNLFTFDSKEIDVAIGFSNAEGSDLVYSYTNGLFNVSGGEHTRALQDALVKSLLPYKGRSEYTPADLKEGLLGLINYKISAPSFNTQIKEKLVDKRVYPVAFPQLLKAFEDFWKKNKSLAKDVVQRAAELRKKTHNFLADKRLVQKVKGAKKALSAKLADVSDPKTPFIQREIYLVEGDSASGSGHKNTLVQLQGDKVITFGEMAERASLNNEKFYGYALDIKTKQTVPIEFDTPRITNWVTEYYEIELEDGSVERFTGEHLFLLSSGEYVPVRDLISGMELQTGDINCK